MNTHQEIITTSDELVAATKNAMVRQITVRGNLSNTPSIRLAPGQQLVGEGDQTEVLFSAGVDGLQLTSDNQVRGLNLRTSLDKRDIFNDTTVNTLGHLHIAGVTTIGQVQILARDKVRSGHLKVDGLDIIAADTRAQGERPHGYGVYVIQGAFTLWNMQADKDIMITADLVGLSAGRITKSVVVSLRYMAHV